ncbi:MAG TPA: SGNH/GDSL hydrolase family protein [Pyrinomonadaceae bacterium]|nr:SGNH/GDSL hydrolase family protein [Pyrinomonadaceae bacterium]
MKPSIAKAAIALTSILFTLGVLEVGLRVFFAVRGKDIKLHQPSSAYNRLSDNRRFTEHPFLPYAPRPNDARTLYIYRGATNHAYSYTYALNSLGFRTPERPFHKEPGTKRIVTLGGSTTVDGFTDSDTWPALLEAKLNDRYRDKAKVEVINLGMDMASSPTSLVDLAFLGVEYQPDLVISYDGVNDAALLGHAGFQPDYRNVFARYDENYQTVQSWLPGWAFRSYLVTLISRKLDTIAAGSDIGSQVMKVDRLPPATNPIEGIEYYERNLKTMRAIAREYNARFVGATAHWVAPDTKVQAMNDELRVFFARESINYLDLDRLLAHDDWSLHVDAVHWTRAGVEQGANAWADKIQRENLLDLN